MEILRKNEIKKAVSILKSGGIIIYPTETSYGLGCDYTNKKAVRKIYKIKGRSKGKPFITLVDNIKMAKKYGIINKIAIKLIKKFMPGPLTLIVKGKKSEEFTFRISSNKIANSLVKSLGKPLVSTSANISGKRPFYNSKNAIKQFDENVDAIIDAGKIPKIKPSTVVKVHDKKITIIREGVISNKKIMNTVRGS